MKFSKYEKYQRFLSENFQGLEVKCFIYLNRCVFVMRSKNNCLLYLFLYYYTGCFYVYSYIFLSFIILSPSPKDQQLTNDHTTDRIDERIEINRGYLFFCCEYHKYCDRVKI